MAATTPAPITPAPITPAPITPAPVGPGATPPPRTPAPDTDPPTSYLPQQVDPLLGQILVGRYLIQKKLGEGGMGAVYLATHNLLEKQVALKVLHGEFARKPDLVERFMQEAKSASRIRHENVIDISDFGTTPEGLVFFAMELLKGHDLHEEIARARMASQLLPWDRSKRIFLQICAALSAAHALGIVHRDLKPENIYLVDFLGEPDFVKLLDFGIAKLIDVGENERKLTRTGMLFGTPEYMSPEQARGETVDHRVDVYAMGCILFQLVTGRVPFEAENFMGVLTMHLTEPPPPVPSEVLDSIGAPRELAQVIAKALAKDRNQRHASIDELARAVRHASGDKPTGIITAQASVPAPRTTAQTARTKTEWTGNLSIPEIDPGVAPRASKLPLILGAVVLVLGAAGVASYVASRGGPAPDTTAAGSNAVVPPVTPPVAVKPAPPTPPVEVPAPATAPPALAFERAEIRLDSVPGNADVRDLASNGMIGHTPMKFTVPASRTPRQFALHRNGYRDAVVELVPDRTEIVYSEKLERGTSAPGAAPVVRKVPAPPAPATPGKLPLPPTTPEPAKPEPAKVEPAKPEPAKVDPPATPAAPATKPTPPEDCEPPCLKADPSRQGSGS
jgi:serine/threonine-protein kinase